MATENITVLRLIYCQRNISPVEKAGRRNFLKLYHICISCLGEACKFSYGRCVQYLATLVGQ